MFYNVLERSLSLRFRRCGEGFLPVQILLLLLRPFCDECSTNVWAFTTLLLHALIDSASVLFACCSTVSFAMVRIVTLVTDFYEIRSACSMPTRELLSPAQRTQFLYVPTEMSEQMLARYYTLSDDDR